MIAHAKDEVLVISPYQVKYSSGHFDLSSVMQLDLSSLNIKCMRGVESCTSLIDLNLSHNFIIKVEGLTTLVKLKRLNLSYNKLKKLPADCFLQIVDQKSDVESEREENVSTKLQYLHLEGNKISDDELFAGLNSLINLKVLSLKHQGTKDVDSACRSSSSRYYNFFLDKRRFPNLQYLDEENLVLRHADAVADASCKNWTKMTEGVKQLLLSSNNNTPLLFSQQCELQLEDLMQTDSVVKLIQIQNDFTEKLRAADEMVLQSRKKSIVTSEGQVIIA